MTLKNRNRSILVLLGISIATLLFQCFLILNLYINGNFTFENLYDATKTGFFLTTSQNLYVLIGILFEYLLVIVDSYVVYRSFVKTQAPEVPFFILMLFSVLFDTFRLWILTYNLSDTFSPLFIFCGNACLFSSILTPLALLLMTIISFTEQKQNYDKFTAGIFLISLFLASLIPLNTTKTLPNYSVDYSFRSLIIVYSILSYIIALTAHFFNNKIKGYNQLTTIGLAMLFTGIHLLKFSLNLLILLLSLGLLVAGSVLFLKELHNQYLWTD